MAKTETATKKKDTRPVDHGDVGAVAVVEAKGALALRLPYPRSVEEAFNVDQRRWKSLVDSIFPSAQTIEAVIMALDYCKARNLDVMKKPVHIVPVYNSQLERYVETVWPSIAEIRITAARTHAYAGKDATEFGPTIHRVFEHRDTRRRQHDDDEGEKVDRKEIDYPEWAQVTVYRMVQGVRCAFVGPKVFWEEAYATKNRWSEVPNEMWGDRPFGQLEKCAEAAALRMAFPEELGNEYAAEEMEGRTIDAANLKTYNAKGQEVVNPKKPERSDFERGTDPVTGEKVAGNKPAGRSRKKKDPAAPKDGQAPKDEKPQESTIDRGKRLLAGLKDHADVGDLHQSIMEELRDGAADDDTVRAWTTACEDRFLALGGKPPEGK